LRTDLVGKPRRDNCRFIAVERRSLTTDVPRASRIDATSVGLSWLENATCVRARARAVTHDASFGRVSNIERAGARRVSNLSDSPPFRPLESQSILPSTF
jgi:hypothetical protein